jgi:hypothetical protein
MQMQWSCLAWLHPLGEKNGTPEARSYVKMAADPMA